MLRWFLCLAVVRGTLSFIESPAFAQMVSAAAPRPLGETLVGTAREDYESGRRLYESGDYAGALAEFQGAYRASSDPRLLWNAAVCEQGMKRYARAIALVHRYLDAHPVLLEREAQNFLHAAEARTAPVDVQACVLRCELRACGCQGTELGAVVSIDGDPMGTIPLAADARIDLGMHRLNVTKDGFQEYATTVNVVTSAELHVVAVLVPVAPAAH
jgi:hypothetical protein